MTGGQVPDGTDRTILEVLQEEIPLVPRPWAAVAERAGIPEGEVIARVQALQDAGIIRSISPILDPPRMGFPCGTLVAFRVPEHRLDEVAGMVSSYPEVSHNFCREHRYPLWFTVSAGTPGDVDRVVAGIAERAGMDDPDVLNLPTVQRFKIDLRFPILSGGKGGNGHGRD